MQWETNPRLSSVPRFDKPIVEVPPIDFNQGNTPEEEANIEAFYGQETLLMTHPMFTKPSFQ